MSEQRLTPNFRKAIGANGVHSADPDDQMVFVPALRRALYDPDHPSVDITVPGFGPEHRRKPDGWFHPSTHPTWSEAALYHYLVNPGKLRDEVWEQEGVMAVGAGHFFHDLIQHVGLHHGMLVEQNCPCSSEHNKAEMMLSDTTIGSRGHTDGALPDGSGFEMKTAHPALVSGLKKVAWDDRNEYWREKKPAYYAQAQEYLRMSGRERMVMLVLQTSYPYDMTEVHIPYDRVEAERIRSKYLRVRQMVADGGTPTATSCCSKFSTCPAGALCEWTYT